jgi:alpha-beta hydrolase superfamily lysophospholipase
MKHTEYRWKSYDGLELYGQAWTTEGKPKAIINLLHNHGEHSGIYEDFARNLTDSNYNIVSMDLRGHGRSEGKRGYASSYRKLIKDLETLIEKSESLFPGYPKILIGQGLGGNIAIYYLSTHITNISSLVVLSPWLVLEQRFPKSKQFIGNIIRHILPTFMLVTGFTAEDRRRNGDAVRKYKNDPFMHDKISIRLFYEIIFAGQRSSRSIYKINMPVLVMHGTADTIASYKASKNFVLNASKKTVFKEWPDYYHDLLTDEGSDEVIGYIKNWLDSQPWRS